MTQTPVIQNCSYCLIHVPDLVRYGSKPRRQIVDDADIDNQIADALRSYQEAVCYPANQTFIGNLSPSNLAAISRPWSQHPIDPGHAEATIGPFGEIMDQEMFYALLKLADQLNPPLYEIDNNGLNKLQQKLEKHPLLGGLDDQLLELTPHPLIRKNNQPPHHGLPITSGTTSFGTFFGDRRSEGLADENLSAHNLLENLCSKASGALALTWLLKRADTKPEQIDFIISCGEEACGDRYQRGGGGMAKAIGEMCGCVNSSGMDIKNFCAAPASAIVTAAAFVRAGLFGRVAVVGGGSLAKLGMKYQSFLAQEVPILDDCLASMAFLISKDDGNSPIIRMEQGGVGTVPVGASTSEESVFYHYLVKPLENLGLTFADIDKFATELQNPEIMEYAGSGDVTAKNYRKIAAMAVMAKELDRHEMNSWIDKVGMVGFAPTQGHIPSAVPFIGHAVKEMAQGKIKRVIFLSRASLFLNRCTNLMDGVSFILEKNPSVT